MYFLVPNIAKVSMNKMALSISVGVDLWAAKRAIIASNDLPDWVSSITGVTVWELNTIIDTNE